MWRVTAKNHGDEAVVVSSSCLFVYSFFFSVLNIFLFFLKKQELACVTLGFQSDCTLKNTDQFDIDSDEEVLPQRSLAV